MSILSARLQPIKKSLLFPELFSLEITLNPSRTTLDMQVLTSDVNTRNNPYTYKILRLHLPSVLRSQCFNDDNLPFRQEVKHTEIGHLFEHILLEYLCLIKLRCGYQSALYRGVTNWNWKKEPFGLFHIKINAGLNDQTFLPEALQKSIELIQLVMKQQEKEMELSSQFLLEQLDNLTTNF